MSKLINFHIDDSGIAYLRLNRPDKRNALNEEMIEAISAHCRQLASTSSPALVLSGGGAAFCAGADLQWMQQQFAAPPDERLRQTNKLASMLASLDTLPMPVVSVVHNAVYAGGLGLLAVSDRVVAVGAVKFCFNETRLGLIAATISPYVYARAGDALRDWFITAHEFDVPTAQRLGLVSEGVEAQQVDNIIANEIQQLRRCDAEAMRHAKALLRGWRKARVGGDPPDTAALLAECWQRRQTQQRIQRFLDKQHNNGGNKHDGKN